MVILFFTVAPIPTCVPSSIQTADVRETVAKFINCEAKEVVFTSGTTQSLNMIALNYGLKNLKKA